MGVDEGRRVLNPSLPTKKKQGAYTPCRGCHVNPDLINNYDMHIGEDGNNAKSGMNICMFSEA